MKAYIQRMRPFFYMPHHVLTEDVLEEKIPNRNGHVVVPDGLG
ncbi:hypothetical protein J2Y48_002815 [Mycoplana sp. BE70]|nr:hypothetical protein [Mycoplana sp. BE70]MDR6757519.1 hypothetical protein [Mycoplana sp. BE70]